MSGKASKPNAKGRKPAAKATSNKPAPRTKSNLDKKVELSTNLMSIGKVIDATATLAKVVEEAFQAESKGSGRLSGEMRKAQKNVRLLTKALTKAAPTISSSAAQLAPIANNGYAGQRIQCEEKNKLKMLEDISNAKNANWNRKKREESTKASSAKFAVEQYVSVDKQTTTTATTTSQPAKKRRAVDLRLKDNTAKTPKLSLPIPANGVIYTPLEVHQILNNPTLKPKDRVATIKDWIKNQDILLKDRRRVYRLLKQNPSEGYNERGV
jgi:hypothetical protein